MVHIEDDSGASTAYINPSTTGRKDRTERKWMGRNKKTEILFRNLLSYRAVARSIQDKALRHPDNPGLTADGFSPVHTHQKPFQLAAVSG